MILLALPEPPNPSDNQFLNNPKAYNLAQYRWSLNIKSQLTSSSRINSRPVAQNFSLGAFTTATTLTGTDTTTNVAQVLCTLIQSLITKGILKPQPTTQ